MVRCRIDTTPLYVYLTRSRMPPVESRLNYTKARDIHSVGIVLLQMLMGRDVMEKYPNPQTALQLRALLFTSAALFI